MPVGFMGFLLLLLSCEDHITGDLNKNLPPETTVFIQSSDTLNYTQSIQKIHWDGSDPDGFVTGFYYTFEENPADEDWEWTTKRTKTFPLKITGEDTVYLFQVKAVDDDGMEDPTPAKQLFPILNSPPDIDWVINSNIPDTTFTVASFAWNATDPDGDSTIAYFEYALDDTSDTTNWHQIPGDRRTITLKEADGVIPGDHAFYIRAVDIADAQSPTIRMPISSNKFWHVREPQGRYLLIDDYAVESSISKYPDAYYTSMLDSLLGVFGDDYSYWNIEELFPASTNQFIETVKLFDRVIWYTDAIDEGDPHFVAAQLAIPALRSKEGKLIYTVQFNSGFGGQGNPLDFSPVDSLGDYFNVIGTNSMYIPDTLGFQSEFPELLSLPRLKVSGFILGVFSLVPKANSVPIYRYDQPNTDDDPIFIMVGRNDSTNEPDFVFAGTPLHFLNENNNLNRFFDVILQNLFGP